MDPLDSKSYVPPSSSLSGVPCHHTPHAMEVFCRTFIPGVSTASCRLTLTAPSNQPGFVEIAINRNLLENYAQVLRPTKTLQPRITSQRTNQPPPRSNARRPLRNRQSRRRPEQPPGSNTKVCLGSVSMTFLQQGGES